MAIPSISINYLAVFIAAIASMIVGFLWYGPIFGKKWIALMKFTDKEMKKAKEKGKSSYFIMFISTLVMAYVLAHFIGYLSITAIAEALQTAFWIWLGFIATILLSSVLWEGKCIPLYLLNVFYYLVSLSVMAIILVIL